MGMPHFSHGGCNIGRFGGSVSEWNCGMATSVRRAFPKLIPCEIGSVNTEESRPVENSKGATWGSKPASTEPSSRTN
jgi:hypothetical protein